MNFVYAVVNIFESVVVNRSHYLEVRETGFV